MVSLRDFAAVGLVQDFSPETLDHKQKTSTNKNSVSLTFISVKETTTLLRRSERLRKPTNRLILLFFLRPD